MDDKVKNELAASKAIVITHCFNFCNSKGSLLLTAYLNSNSPLFSIVNEPDLRLPMTRDPKLT